MRFNMPGKWEEFNSKYSPINAGTVDTGANNIVQDWQRLMASNHAKIKEIWGR